MSKTWFYNFHKFNILHLKHISIQNYIHSLYIYYTTTSYTVISLLYLGLGLTYFFLFFFMSLAIRAELNCLGFYTTGNGAFEIYNAIITSHGLGMIFLFIMPTVISFVGNWQLPQGWLAMDFASPRLNLASLYLLVLSSQLVVLSVAREEGLNAGWTIYPPLSDARFSSSSSMNVAILALHIMGASSEGGAATFIVTALVTRLGGVYSILSCLLTWCILTASVLLLLTLPVLGAGITLLLLDRTCNTAYVSPTDLGDPLVFQHLFWYFGHPEVYVIILPAFGIVSWLLARFTSYGATGHIGMLLAILSIAAVGFYVWAHHMFVAGISDDARLYFSAATMIIGVPTAVKLFTWCSAALSLPVLTSDYQLLLALQVCFMIGGFTGLALSSSAMDCIYHDSYYVVGHFHLVLSIAALFSVLAALRIFSLLAFHTRPSETSTRSSTSTATVSVLWLFGLQHMLGVDGHPRRIFTSSEMHQLLTEITNVCIPLILWSPASYCSLFTVYGSRLSSLNTIQAKYNVMASLVILSQGNERNQNVHDT